MKIVAFNDGFPGCAELRCWISYFKSSAIVQPMKSIMIKSTEETKQRLRNLDDDCISVKCYGYDTRSSVF